MDRAKLVSILANCHDDDADSPLHQALCAAFSVTEDEIEAAPTEAAASACC